ncbi:MAG: hypothetical protein HFI92_07590 [Lachnospiraceae bacterium]|nr:hypothetical protein [Lachnospiraceae bacterium]
MKQTVSKGMILLFALFMLTGCSGSPKEEEPEEPALMELSQIEIPVTIDEHEILVGRTTIQELLDDGFTIMISEWRNDQVLQYAVDPEEILEPGVNYSELFFEVTDSVFVRLSVRPEEEGIRMGDAAITRLELHLSHIVDTLPDNVLLEGVPVNDLSVEQARSMFPDFNFVPEDLCISDKGLDYKCSLMFSPSSLNLYQFILRSTVGDPPEPEIKVPSVW